MLQFDDDGIGVSVADVLADPERFHEQDAGRPDRGPLLRARQGQALPQHLRLGGHQLLRARRHHLPAAPRRGLHRGPADRGRRGRAVRARRPDAARSATWTRSPTSGCATSRPSSARCPGARSRPPSPTESTRPAGTRSRPPRPHPPAQPESAAARAQSDSHGQRARSGAAEPDPDDWEASAGGRDRRAEQDLLRRQPGRQRPHRAHGPRRALSAASGWCSCATATSSCSYAHRHLQGGRDAARLRYRARASARRGSTDYRRRTYDRIELIPSGPCPRRRLQSLARVRRRAEGRRVAHDRGAPACRRLLGQRGALSTGCSAGSPTASRTPAGRPRSPSCCAASRAPARAWSARC